MGLALFFGQPMLPILFPRSCDLVLKGPRMVHESVSLCKPRTTQVVMFSGSSVLIGPSFGSGPFCVHLKTGALVDSLYLKSEKVLKLVSKHDALPPNTFPSPSVSRSYLTAAHQHILLILSLGCALAPAASCLRPS